MRIIVLEENKKLLHKIVSLFNIYIKEKQLIKIEIIFFDDLEAFISSQNIKSKDVILLGLPVSSNVKAVNFLKSFSVEFLLILISEIKVDINPYLHIGTFGQITKNELTMPVLSEMLNQIYEIYLRSAEIIVLNNENEIVKIKLKDILYIDLYKRQLRFNLKSEIIITKYRVFSKINEIFMDNGLNMDDFCFAYIYSAMIVNLDNIIKVGKGDRKIEITLYNSEIFSVSRSMKKKFYDKYLNFIKNQHLSYA